MIIETQNLVIEIEELETLYEHVDSKGRKYREPVIVGLYGIILSGVPKWMKPGTEFVVNDTRIRAKFRLRNQAGQIVSTGKYELEYKDG